MGISTLSLVSLEILRQHCDSSKSGERHPGAKELMQDVPQQQLVNHEVAVVAVGHDDQAGFSLHRSNDKGCKSRVASAMHDEVAVLCVPDLPAQRLGNRVIDFHLRLEHFRAAGLIEPKRIASFWIDHLDEKLRVVCRSRM